MTGQSPTLIRCERCRAVISSAEASKLVRDGASCGVCGGALTLWDEQRHGRSGDGRVPRPTAERRLLGVLREADGRPVGPGALANAGISDPANAIDQLERAGHRIERAYADASIGPRRFLGYHLGPDRQRRGAQRARSQ